MPDPRGTPSTAAVQRVAAWAGVALAAIGVLGLLYAPGARILWIVLLVFAVGAVPQVVFRVRLEERRERERRGR
jgi:cyanate permease